MSATNPMLQREDRRNAVKSNAIKEVRREAQGVMTACIGLAVVFHPMLASVALHMGFDKTLIDPVPQDQLDLLNLLD